jgi:hypothetical protein
MTVGQASKAGAPQGPATNGQGAGKPDDAASAFAAEVAAAIRRQEAGAGDGGTAAAIALGWHVAAIANDNVASTAAAAGGAAAAGLAVLTEAQAVAYCVKHVEVACAKLQKLVEAAKIEGTDLAFPVDAVRECLEATPADRADKAADMDAKALAILGAVDFRLGKGYGVGRSLMRLATPPAGDLEHHLGMTQVAPLAAALDDLTTALPAHAGHAVRASIEEWALTVEDPGDEQSDEKLRPLLSRQAVVWQTVLTGEKAAHEMLEIDDYLDAAQRLSERVRSVVRSFLARFWRLVALIVLLFAGGVALLVTNDGGAAAVAGAGGILASLGLSWRAVGTSLGRIVSKVEQPLWGAEIDVAVTRAITLIKPNKGHDPSERRRHVAEALDTRSAGDTS